FQVLTDELGMTEGLARDGGYDAAALGIDADEVSVGKLDQRLATRGPADAETTAKIEFRHRRPRRQRTADDLVQQSSVDLIGQPPARLVGRSRSHVLRL